MLCYNVQFDATFLKLHLEVTSLSYIFKLHLRCYILMLHFVVMILCSDLTL